MKDFTDCPDVFLKWGSLLAISSCLSRKACYESGSWDQAPNIWLILIGKSSSHKSIAISRVEELIESIEPRRLAPHEFTQESIIKSLSEYSERLFVFDEAKAFFDATTKKYNEGLSTLMTTLYRKPNYTRSTLKHGTITIQNAYLTMGMATTPEWLRKSIHDAQESAMSGFLSRFLLVPFAGDPNKAIPRPPAHNQQKFAELKDILRSYQLIEHPFDYTADAAKAFDAWFYDIAERGNQALPIFGPFYEHFKNEAIHKLAILYAVDRGEQIISRSALGEAICALDYIESTLPSLVEDLTSDSLERERRKIIDYIRKQGLCRREALASVVHVHGEKLTRHLHGMQDDDLIKVFASDGKTKKVMMIEWVGAQNGSTNNDGALRDSEREASMVG